MTAPRSLKSRALQLLAQRDQSRAELRRKLLAFARERAVAPRGAALGFAGRPGQTANAAREDHLRTSDHDDDEASDRCVAEVDALLDWLAQRQFLSDERFAESRIHARAARYGNLRIRAELAQHRVGLAPEAEHALAESELTRAAAVRSRKFVAMPTSPAERARQARFLAARGFSPEVIRNVLRAAALEDEGDAAA